jgi:hypothetical protein
MIPASIRTPFAFEEIGGDCDARIEIKPEAVRHAACYVELPDLIAVHNESGRGRFPFILLK